VRRELQGKIQHRLLDLRLNTVPRIGFAPRFLQQRLNAAIVSCRTVPIEGIARHPHHLAGFGHVPKLFGQVQQSDLVSNDSLCRLVHEGYPYGFD
jgi:hypothetical protein